MRLARRRGASRRDPLDFVTARVETLTALRLLQWWLILLRRFRLRRLGESGRRWMDRAVRPPDSAVGSGMVTILESAMSGPTARMWAVTVSSALTVSQFRVIGPCGR